MDIFGDVSSMNLLINEVDKMNVFKLQNFLLSRGITVSKRKRIDLLRLVKAAVNLDLEGNVDFHEDSLDLSE